MHNTRVRDLPVHLRREHALRRRRRQRAIEQPNRRCAHWVSGHSRQPNDQSPLDRQIRLPAPRRRFLVTFYCALFGYLHFITVSLWERMCTLWVCGCLVLAPRSRLCPPPARAELLSF